MKEALVAIRLMECASRRLQESMLCSWWCNVVVTFLVDDNMFGQAFEPIHKEVWLKDWPKAEFHLRWSPLCARDGGPMMCTCHTPDLPRRVLRCQLTLYLIFIQSKFSSCGNQGESVMDRCNAFPLRHSIPQRWPPSRFNCQGSEGPERRIKTSPDSLNTWPDYKTGIKLWQECHFGESSLILRRFRLWSRSGVRWCMKSSVAGFDDAETISW